VSNYGYWEKWVNLFYSVSHEIFLWPDILSKFIDLCAVQHSAMTETYTITELAREFDVTPRAIRYWEDQGLVAPGRAGQARVFDKRDRTRLKLALRGKRLGLSLAEIKELIDMYDSAGSEATQLQSFLDVLAGRRAALEQQRDDIAAVLEEVARFEAQCQQLLEEANKPS
jgi:DNA-binding transcriptional MerR regulator